MNKAPIIAFALIIVVGLLTGCATRDVYHPITPPALLTNQVTLPTPPAPEAATQSDVAIYLIELNAALEMCNAQLDSLEKWGGQWK